MKYNIAIIPPDTLCDQVISISQELYKMGGQFVLGNQVNFAHITIAHFECYDENVLERIIDENVSQLDKIHAFNIKQDEYRMNNGWVDISFQKISEILSLYEIVLNTLQKYNCKKTSDDWECNAPHLTLSKFANSKDFDIATLPKHDFSFIVEEIGIFELGEYGTNKKLVKEFKLQ